MSFTCCWTAIEVCAPKLLTEEQSSYSRALSMLADTLKCANRKTETWRDRVEAINNQE